MATATCSMPASRRMKKKANIYWCRLAVTLLTTAQLLASSAIADIAPYFGTNSASTAFQEDAGIGKSTCPIGYFGCETNSSICVVQAKVCNGVQDCPDGSDENHKCEDRRTDGFFDAMFKKRPGAKAEEDDSPCQLLEDSNEDIRGPYGLEHFFPDQPAPTRGGIIAPRQRNITVSNSDYTKETSMGNGSRLSWKYACKCLSVELYCGYSANLDLLSLPRGVKLLDLTGIPVNIKSFQQVNLQELEELILSHSSFANLGPYTFRSFPSLTTVHLSSNRLKKIPGGVFNDTDKLELLFLDRNQITELSKDAFFDLKNLLELDMSFNELTKLETSIFNGLPKLKMLQLTSNSIEVIEPGTFANLMSLEKLFLASNRLTRLQTDMFCNLRSLHSLFLHENQIARIDPGAFSCLNKMESLNLQKNRFGEVHDPRTLFSNLTSLEHIYFDQFWMCWWVPHVRDCWPKGDGISSDKNLLDNSLLRISVWLMGILGVAGNIFVIVSRMVFREPNRVHSFYIKNLALADLLMGLYLLSIAFHDISFRGEFLAHQYKWRHSWICQYSGLLCTISSEASVLILTLITLDRYFSIVRPFASDRSRGSLVPAATIICVLWSASFILSYLPLSTTFSDYFGLNFYSSNGLCLPLNIHNPFDAGWEYSLTLFVIINSVAFTFISYAYWRMLRIIQSSALTIRSTQQKQDTMLAKRFGLVVFTDFLCWAPVIIAKVLATCGLAIPPIMYAWLAVFVLPVNSALNPIIYTMTTKQFKQQMSKLAARFRKKFGNTGDADESGASNTFLNRRRTQKTLTSSYGGSLRWSSLKLNPRHVIERPAMELQPQHQMITSCSNLAVDQINPLAFRRPSPATSSTKLNLGPTPVSNNGSCESVQIRKSRTSLDTAC